MCLLSTFRRTGVLHPFIRAALPTDKPFGQLDQDAGLLLPIEAEFVEETHTVYKDF